MKPISPSVPLTATSPRPMTSGRAALGSPRARPRPGRRIRVGGDGRERRHPPTHSGLRRGGPRLRRRRVYDPWPPNGWELFPPPASRLAPEQKSAQRRAGAIGNDRQPSGQDRGNGRDHPGRAGGPDPARPEPAGDAGRGQWRVRRQYPDPIGGAGYRRPRARLLCKSRKQVSTPSWPKSGGSAAWLRLTTSATDVTGQYVDLQARITALQDSRQQYLTIMAKATTVGGILAVQEQLQNLQSQLEQLQGQLQLLNNETTYATLAVTVSQKVVTPPPPRPESGLSEGVARRRRRVCSRFRGRRQGGGAVVLWPAVTGRAGPVGPLGLEVPAPYAPPARHQNPSNSPPASLLGECRTWVSFAPHHLTTWHALPTGGLRLKWWSWAPSNCSVVAAGAH